MRKKYKSYLYYAIIILCIIVAYSYLKNKREGFEGSAPPLNYTTESKIKVFTYATEIKPTLRLLLLSLKMHNYSYEVVGFGTPWKGFRNRVYTYLSAVKKYRETNGDDAVAVVLDGYDCLCIKDSERVYNDFINKPRSIPVMFGVEVYCLGNCNKNILSWYDYHRLYGGEQEISKELAHIPEGLTSKKPVFLNGGMVIGTSKELESVYTGMMELNIEDDQICAATYAVNNKDDVDLDVEEVIFRNKKQDITHRLPEEDGVNGPGFLHFPGARDKNNFSDLLVLFDFYL